MTTVELPTEYVTGRFFVRPITIGGAPLRFFTDTGGGDFMRQSTVSALGLATESLSLGDKQVTVASWPQFSPDVWIPAVSAADDPRPAELKGRLLVYPDESVHVESDGTLGQAWFGGRIWTFDYPSQRLLFSSSLPESVLSVGTASLGFPVASNGRRVTHFPSIDATIDGATHAFLFDTGATAYLTDEGRNHLGDAPQRATCFITAWLFERWRDRHPEWQVIEQGDVNVGGQPMIEVSSVEIGGLEAGPVWFTRRPDANFHEFMSSMMDRRVEGALGGSLLQYFVVTLDYPSATAYFKLDAG